MSLKNEVLIRIAKIYNVLQYYNKKGEREYEYAYDKWRN